MFKEKIRETIIDYKERHNISRSEMARRLGVPYSSLQEWENMSSLINGEDLVRLITLTGADIQQFTVSEN